MGKQVPLVLYKNGVRHVIGQASVSDDGAIEAQIAKDAWPVVKELMDPRIREFSLVPPRPGYTIVNDPPFPRPFTIQGVDPLRPKIQEI